MAKILNVAFTCCLLVAALFAWLASVYDGYCYGFTDGKSSCSFAEHIDANLSWLPFMLIYFFPHVFIVGYLVYTVNGVIHRLVVQRLGPRWLEAVSDGPATGFGGSTNSRLCSAYANGACQPATVSRASRPSG